MLPLIKKLIKRSAQAQERRKAGMEGNDASRIEIAVGKIAVPTLFVARNARHIMEQGREEWLVKKTCPVRPHDWAFVCGYGIGDTYMACGLAQAIINTHGGDSLIVFTKPQHHFIPSLFPGVTRSFIVPPHLQAANLGSPYFSQGKLFHAHFSPSNLMNLMGYKGITLLDGYRALFNLPLDVPVQPPTPPDISSVKEAKTALSEIGAVAEKTVILCPDAVSTNHLSRIPMQFWSDLALGLTQKGWTPITNLGPTTECIPGTKAVPIPLPKFRDYAVAAGWVVANRSGLCDLIADLNVKQTVIYPDGRWYGGSILDSSSLNAMGLSDHADELKINGNNSDDVLQTIFSNLCSGRQRHKCFDA